MAPTVERLKSMCKTKQRRAFTLVETVVTCAVITLFLGLVYAMFLPALGLASASSSKAETEVPGSTAMFSLEDDFRVSDEQSLTVMLNGSTTPAAPPSSLGSSSEITAVSFQTAERFDNPNDYHGQYFYDSNKGGPLWQAWIVWALVADAQGSYTLYRTTVADGSPSVAKQQMPTTTFQNTVNTIATNGRVMARGVTSFQLAQQTEPCTGCPLASTLKPEVDFEIAYQSTDSTGNTSQTSFQTEVFTRN